PLPSNPFSLPRRKPSDAPAPLPRCRGAPSPLLEQADDGEAEFGGARAVDDPVVERHRHVADGSGNDLAVTDDRALGDPADAEDRHLRVVHERGLKKTRELAGARDGERRAAMLLALERSCK